MWQYDFGRPDRALFLRDSWRYRLQRLGQRVFGEKLFWGFIASCVAYLAGRML